MRRYLSMLGAAVVLTLVAGTAWAYWTAGSVAGSAGAAGAGAVNQGASPSAGATGSTVTVSWSASTLANGQPVDGYLVRRYDAATSAAQTITSACMGTVTATSCVESNVPDGSWRYTVTPVFATNWQGAESAKSAAVSIDTTAPAAPVLVGISSDTGASATDLITSAASQTLTGTAEAGSTVTVRRGASLLGTATTDAFGVFAVGPVTLTADANTFTATATDAAGNTSVASAGFVVVLDDIEPFSVVISPSSSAWHNTGTWSITADDALSGIHHVSYKVDGAGYADLAAANGVAVSLPVLADGVHTVYAYATDVAGKSTAAVPVNATIRVDTVKPTASVVLQAPNAGGWRTSGQVTVTGTDATSGVDHVEYKIDGAATYTSMASGASFVLADGTHSVTYRAVDVAGNAGDDVTVSNVKVDSAKPQSLVSPVSSTTWRNSGTVTLSATDVTSGVASIGYKLDGAATYTTYAAPITLSDGAHTLVFRAVDAAGNIEADNVATIKVDTQLPTAGISQVGSGQPTITGTDQAALSGVASVSYRIGGSGAYTTVPGSSTTLALATGTYTVWRYATDNAGNSSVAVSSSVTVDGSAPTLANPVPANNSASTAWANIDCQSGSFSNRLCVDVSDTGSGVNASTVTFKLVRTSSNQCWNGSAWVAGTGCAAQPMTLVSGAQYRSGGSALSGMTDGTYSVTFAASDNAGNASSLATTFTVENSAPTGTIINPSTSGYTVGGCGTASVWDVCGTAADAGSGVDRVEIKLQHNGLLFASDRCLTSSGTWTAACNTTLTATVDGSGSWSYVTGALPGDGFLQWYGYTLTVYVYDRAGNLTTLTRDFDTP
ncbi:MAG TPA: fibronectin type III domain-containing protein [Nocardioides sp.]|uniref:fibronectin type III domain-containing protein n=1 Tax=Nocardioides sp. TaxID=35761 RepID=UPI002E31DCD4|nr:fibronectin type III domain-containing protein [Nocardioides sp.]HEX5090464.1 fibronectin type III domain-containing protein [Nocardioides sp.]